MSKHIKPTSNIYNITYGFQTFTGAMLLQSYLNKWWLMQLDKLYKLYINAKSTRILQISHKDYIEYRNQIFRNNSHIHLISCDAVSSYHFPSPISGSKFLKWDCILNCCAYCPGMNAPYLESSKQLYCLFLGSLHEIKLYIKNYFFDLWIKTI